MNYISEASKFMYDDDYIVEATYITFSDIAKIFGSRGKKPEKPIMAFLKKNKNKIQDEVMADVIGYYGIDGEDYFDDDGNWLDEAADAEMNYTKRFASSPENSVKILSDRAEKYIGKHLKGSFKFKGGSESTELDGNIIAVGPWNLFTDDGKAYPTKKGMAIGSVKLSNGVTPKNKKEYVVLDSKTAKHGLPAFMMYAKDAADAIKQCDANKTYKGYVIFDADTGKLVRGE